MINTDLNNLFKSWQQSMLRNGHEGFCYDGLIYRGGAEDNLWRSSKRRIVLILKEQNDNDGADVREWSGSLNGQSPYRNFFNRIAAWLYGLTNATPTSYPELEVAFDSKNQMEALSKYPYAYINIKKQTGGAAANDIEIYEHASIYREYLREQLEILEGNILLCGGQVVFDCVKNLIYSDLKFHEVNDWIWNNKDRGITLINSFHPAAIGKSNEQMYNWMMEKFIKIL